MLYLGFMPFMVIATILYANDILPGIIISFRLFWSYSSEKTDRNLRDFLFRTKK